MIPNLNNWIKHTAALSALLGITACSSSPALEIIIQQEEDNQRLPEMIEVPANEWKKILQEGQREVVLFNQSNEEIPYQITHDGNLIFLVQAKTKEHKFKLVTGTPQNVVPSVYGRQYPERADDIAWENDCSAYRAYGPALQKRGERAFGYDIMTKLGENLVIEKRYAMELDKTARKQMKEWYQAGLREKADSLSRAISYHIDHGNGMDCYNVGATLGGGTNALLDAEGNIIYPYCYKDYKVVENGPLRFSVELTFHPTDIGDNQSVVEKRIITLDKGSCLNKTTVRYENLQKESSFAVGIVIHPQNKDGYLMGNSDNYIAYVDSTNNVKANNGLIYVGAVFPKKLSNKSVQWFDKTDKSHPGALGHILAISTYQPHTDFVYYWGSGWSKNEQKYEKDWEQYLKKYSRQLHQPLTVTYKIQD